EQYRKEFLSSFPDQKSKYSAKSISFEKLTKDASAKYRQKISEAENAVSEYRTLTTDSGALRVLQELSTAIPKNVMIDVTLFDFKTTLPGEGKLVLRAETDNFSSQATIIENLKKSPILKDVEEKNSGTIPGSDGKKIEFTLNANYINKE
ncbi:MAG: PilN domain-containing protein, partial [Oligoflexales bacterium]|nr:PilN domain-containing protein [Oligoflexales bacterium]